MKNSTDQGWGCYSQRPKAEVDNALRDLQNSSYPTIAEFNNCFIIYSKYFPIHKGVSLFCSLFFHSPKTTQPHPLVFSVHDSVICSGLHFWCHFDVIGLIIFSRLHFWHYWFNIWSTAAAYGELCIWFRPIRNGEIFWMNNRHNYWINNLAISFKILNIVTRLSFYCEVTKVH